VKNPFDLGAIERVPSDMQSDPNECVTLSRPRRGASIRR
jgi:hypothetical protein